MPPARLYGDDLAWDRTATHLEDRESHVPHRSPARACPARPYRGVDLFETATEPGAVVELPFVWNENENWRDGYYKVSEANIDELRRTYSGRKT